MMVAKMLLAASEYGLDRDSVLDGYASSGGDRSLTNHPLRLLALEQMDPFISNTCNDGHWSGGDEDLRRSEELGPSAVQRIREAVQRHRSHADATARLELDSWFGDLA